MIHWCLMPVRNGLAYTRAALPTLLAQDIGDVCVLLIDNDSTDGTGEWARSRQIANGPVFYRHCRPPLSVAASWNNGLRFIFDRLHSDVAGSDYVLVVNNDVELRPDTYRHLVADGGLFVTGVGVDSWEQTGRAWQVIRAHTSDRPDPNFTGFLPPDPAHKRPHPDFSCFLIRRECWERVGPFDEHCEIAFCEDSLFHVKMHRLGIRAECLDLPFYHAGSATIKNADTSEAERIGLAAQRNREYFKSLYGCYPGTKEYEALFEEKWFGVDAHVARMAKPL